MDSDTLDSQQSFKSCGPKLKTAFEQLEQTYNLDREDLADDVKQSLLDLKDKKAASCILALLATLQRQQLESPIDWLRERIADENDDFLRRAADLKADLMKQPRPARSPSPPVCVDANLVSTSTDEELDPAHYPNSLQSFRDANVPLNQGDWDAICEHLEAEAYRYALLEVQLEQIKRENQQLKNNKRRRSEE